MRDYEKRNALVEKQGWFILGWDASENEAERKHVTVECKRDQQSFKKLPSHGSLALWRSILNHKECRHGRKGPPPPKRCKECGQILPEPQPSG